MSAGEVLLAVNCGSSSVKLAVFDRQLDRVSTATASRIGTGSAVELAASGLGTEENVTLPAGSSHADCIAELARLVTGRFGDGVAGIGHRVVHGGTRFTRPLLIDNQVLDEIRALAPLAPAHQPHNIEGIIAFGAAFPHAPQIACFDTAFHRSIPIERQIYAIPAHFAEEGLLAYGFHGLSCEYSVSRFSDVVGKTLPDRLALCHLGNGASVTAVLDGRSVANSMGFTPLDGLVMGSRSGRIDPGAVLWLVDHMGDTKSVRAMLNGQSGLAGLSGISSDMRTLLADPSEQAKRAIAVFVDRLVREIGSAAAALGGLDAIVFTGGIGERAVPIRAAVIDRLGWLGLMLDPAANAWHATTITGIGSSVSAHVIATDEERVIATAVLAQAAG